MQSSFADFDWTLSLIHGGTYLNLDDILATSERTPCRLRVTLPGLASLMLSDANVTGNQRNDHIEGNDEYLQVDVLAGTKLDLPVWLAVSLGSGRRQLLQVDLPLIYRDAYGEIFDAGPSVVDLKKKAPLYYMLLCNLLALGGRTSQIAITGAKIFQARLKSVMDAALNATRHDTLYSTAKFDNLEMSLFRIGQAERLQLERWTKRQTDKIEPTHFLKALRARSHAKKVKPLAETESNTPV